VFGLTSPKKCREVGKKAGSNDTLISHNVNVEAIEFGRKIEK